METMESESKTPTCLFQVIPMIQMTVFWKWAIIIMALLMCLFAWTLVSLTKSIDQQTIYFVNGKNEILEGQRTLASLIHHHTEISLENRNIQTEIKAILYTMQKTENLNNKKHKVV